ncbi:MAG TPA: pyridine nucleotide-disulfide oxidoreductase, partial [Pseudomonadales bacterium]|nr:pyridine nucleotide-disulfide oxidoreductase [Pseudomonadales bacterium]
MRKGAIAVGLLGLVMLFFALGLHRQLTFDQLKESLGQLMAWRAAEPFRSALLFFVLYLLVTALSLPGAAIMTLAAGALFG